jgi:hypothetical protein
MQLYLPQDLRPTNSAALADHPAFSALAGCLHRIGERGLNPFPELVFQMRLRPPALTITPRDHRGPKEKGQSTETKEDSRSGDGYKKPAKRPAHDHLHAAQNNR